MSEGKACSADRRGFLKFAVAAVVAGVVAGVGGYFAGSATVPPPKTITETVTETAAAATVTVTAPARTITETTTVTVASAPPTVILTEPVKLTFTSGPTGGEWFPRAGLMKEIIEPYLPAGSSITVIPGGGSTNIVRLATGEADLGFTLVLALELAGEGAGPFKEKVDITKVKALFMFHIPEVFQFLITEEAATKYGINSIEDIVAKKPPLRLVSISKATATYWGGVLGLEYYGITYEDFVAWGGSMTGTTASEIVSLIRDGHADGFIGTMIPGVAFLQEVTTYKKVKFLSLSDEALEYVISKRPSLWKTVLKAGTYGGVYPEQDIPTFTDPAIMIVRSGLPDNVVYVITKALCENNKKLWDFKKTSGFYPETDWKPVKDILHPGAVKYYKAMGYMD